MSSDHKLQDPAVISQQDGVYTYIDLDRGNVGHQISYFIRGTKNDSNPVVYIVSIMLAITCIPLRGKIENGVQFNTELYTNIKIGLKSLGIRARY